MTRTVLITGPIGSGKSEVRRYLSSRGYPVYDSDSRTKALYDAVPGLKERAEEAAGLPFDRLGEIFSDPSKRSALEAVVYPEVLRDITAWKASQTAPLIFLESAVALEKPQFAGLWDEVWLVEAPYQVRLSRNPKAAERSSSQAPVPRELADKVINNGSSIGELHKQIDRILMEKEKTDLSKILSVSGKHGLYRYLALARGNAVIAESLADGHRTVFDAHSRVTTLADIAIFTSEGELKLKEVFLKLKDVLAGEAAPSVKDSAAVKVLFEKAVPNYDPDRFYASHMKKVLEWYGELEQFASLDFTEEETEEEQA